MSSTEKKTIDFKTTMRDAALASSPSFPDFAQVYKKADQQPKKVRRYVFSVAALAIAAAASFWIGIGWNSRGSSDVALIDSWSSTQTPVAVSLTATGSQQSQVVLASSQKDAVNFFVQDLWTSSSGNGL